MVYQNTHGVIQPSFTIGRGRVKLISKEILDPNDIELLGKYRLSAVDIKSGKEHKIAYDIDIPIHYVSDVRQDPNNPDQTILILKTPDGEKNIPISTNAVKSLDEETGIGNIVLYGSEDGKFIKDSKITIATAVENTDETVPTSKAVVEYFGGNLLLLKTRLDGYYYIYDSDGTRYKVALNQDGTWSYIEDPDNN
jgi:hypothetical protein